MANPENRHQPKDIKNEAHKGHVKAERGDADELRPEEDTHETSDPGQSKRKEEREHNDINPQEAQNISDSKQRLGGYDSEHERNKAMEGLRQDRSEKERNDMD